MCTDADKCRKKFGKEMAHKIKMRINQLEAAHDIHEMLDFHIGRCHLLRANLANKYAVDLVQPFRMVFSVTDDTPQKICIEDIVDYH